MNITGSRHYMMSLAINYYANNLTLKSDPVDFWVPISEGE